VLNGAATRRCAIFKIEVAALYLAERQSSLEAAAAAPGPKRLRLVTLRSVSAEDFHRKFMSDLRSVAAPGELGQLEREIVALGDMLRRVTLREGDVITMDWLPGSGLMAAHNGRDLSTAPLAPEPLHRFVLRIFVGPEASREPLLGLSPLPAEPPPCHTQLP
jgi:hypothetical protein